MQQYIENSSSTNLKLNTEQEQALSLMLNEANRFILLTGDAGTGKSTVIREFITRIRQRGQQIEVSASTGIAATHLDGTTFYRVLKLHPAMNRVTYVPTSLAQVDVIVIDEVSMITAETFDAVFQEIIWIENNLKKKIRLVLVGDFYQLPPVTGKSYYNSHWLFESINFKRNFITIKLYQKMRTDENEFAAMLDLAKNGDPRFLEYINNSCSKTKFQGAPFLCGTREEANKICKYELLKLLGSEKVLKCNIITPPGVSARNKEHPQLETTLVLKVGARVMFTVNDRGNIQYSNGTLGRVTGFDENDRFVWVQIDNGPTIKVERVSLKDEIDENITYTQFPLRLSYAFTIHKAQGMTLEEVNIIPAGWDPGQLYVAISRARRAEKIYLSDKVTAQMLRVDHRVIIFSHQIDEEMKRRSQASFATQNPYMNARSY